MFAVSFFNPNTSSTTTASTVKSGMMAFGQGKTIKNDSESLKDIKYYESNMYSYAKEVENDMKATGNVMEFFH